MTGHDPRPGSPMSSDPLAHLLHDAVDGIEPSPGLAAIRSRTSSPSTGSGHKESPMSIARTWLLGGLGGAVATAAVIGGVWLATGQDENSQPPGPGASPSQSVSPSESPSGSPSESPSNDGSESPQPSGTVAPVHAALPVYYLGETPWGQRLYREFRRLEVTEGDLSSRLQAAVSAAATATPEDPDYHSSWNKTGLTGVSTSWNGDVATIDLLGPAEAIHDGAGVPADQRGVSVQQLVYTAQAALGKGRVPVQLLINGKHTDQVLGESASEPLTNAPVLDTLSLVSLSTPGSGEVVEGDALEVSGVGNSFEATMVIRLQRYEGTYIAYQGSITAEGWGPDKLYPFKGSIDISDVAPGKYVLHAMTDDPSGGAEGPGAYSDTKVIEIK